MNPVIVTIIAVGIGIAIVDIIALRFWAKSLWPLSNDIHKLKQEIAAIKEQLNNT